MGGVSRLVAGLSSKVGRRDVKLKGVFIPLTTPFGTDQEISYKDLKKNMEAYEKIPFQGYVVAGSNGEAPYLTPEERVSLVKFVASNTNKIVIGGATCESTKSTCQLSNSMANAGADGLLIMPPFYFKKRMTEEAIMSHYTTIADSCDLPLIIYNMPYTTGFDISTQTLVKLARHPNIRGVKDSDVRKCAGTVLDTKDLNFDVLIGSAGYLLPALINGCSGGINGLAGILGREICQLYELFKEGRFEEATQLQMSLCRPDTLLLAEMGVPGLKAAMDMSGQLVGGLCRRPVLPPTDLDKQRIKLCLQQSGFM
ncbi:hypothetical protein AAG570_000085 [Ranatra chinensis]|uniref:4-hydroxy-2-oxoglutarate aldolase, mitochondrial n=1 Tax=Ranatra chinensis TaxID=642074 RepID=A0ABD0ZH97_9HEMI